VDKVVILWIRLWLCGEFVGEVHWACGASLKSVSGGAGPLVTLQRVHTVTQWIVCWLCRSECGDSVNFLEA